MTCTWEKQDGRWVCLAKECTHWSDTGCLLGKVSLTCDNDDCKWNTQGHCTCMDVHLDADGKCLGVRE